MLLQLLTPKQKHDLQFSYNWTKKKEHDYNFMAHLTGYYQSTNFFHSSFMK